MKSTTLALILLPLMFQGTTAAMQPESIQDSSFSVDCFEDEVVVTVTSRFELSSTIHPNQLCGQTDSLNGRTIVVQAPKITLTKQGAIGSEDGRSPLHADQCIPGNESVEGIPGGNGGDVILRSPVIILEGTIVLGNGGNGQSINIANCGEITKAIGGNGGSSGKLIMDAESIINHAGIQGGRGGDGGNATAQQHPEPQESSTNRGADGTFEDPDAGDAFAEGMHGEEIAFHGQRGGDAFAYGGNGGTGEQRGGNGGNANATAGDGGNGQDTNNPLHEFAGDGGNGGDATAIGGHGGPAPDAGNGGSGGNAASYSGNGGNGGNHLATETEGMVRGGHGGLGGNATAIGGDASNGTTTGEDGGHAIALGGDGGRGGYAISSNGQGGDAGHLTPYLALAGDGGASITDTGGRGGRAEGRAGYRECAGFGFLGSGEFAPPDAGTAVGGAGGNGLNGGGGGSAVSAGGETCTAPYAPTDEEYAALVDAENQSSPGIESMAAIMLLAAAAMLVRRSE